MYLDDEQRKLVRDMWVRIQHLIHDEYDWEVIYDFAFEHMHSKFRQQNIRVEWHDPDTSYEEDVQFYLYGVRELMESNKMSTRVEW